ncbi:MAG: helix-turn-helix transcriptional regulator [Aneurinibacillus aneurinilyticus]|nr:helix-turn-helix transcriptional regulator [Aneurinibacillus aneurinilyticus]MCI1693807.1 helix-turn-helix transcriptional regulator [Aneurinibacillus aneurinilyticus]
MAIKSRLKLILVERNIRQNDLARRIGVSNPTINAACKGSPTLEVAIKISNVQ